MVDGAVMNGTQASAFGVDVGAGLKFHPEYNWLMTPTMLAAPSLAYVVLAVASHFFMAKYDVKTPAWVPNAMRLYNVVQIVLCFYMAVGLAPVLGLPNVFGISTPYTAKGEWFVFVHYLSKYLDWFDTLWMILKRKSGQQMSFLHLYHHSTIGVVWGFLLCTGHGNGTARYGAWINSVTHVLMYSHYLWTSFGLTNPLKKVLTSWQIFQFYTCFIHAVVVLFVVNDQVMPIELAWIQFFYHITMVYLFTYKLHWVPSCLAVGKPEQKPKAAKKAD